MCIHCSSSSRRLYLLWTAQSRQQSARFAQIRGQTAVVPRFKLLDLVRERRNRLWIVDVGEQMSLSELFQLGYELLLLLGVC